MGTDMVSIHYQDNVAIVKMDRGTTNAINLELATEMTATIEQVRDDASLRSLVLGSSNNKFFSIGFDIPHLYDLPESDFTTYYQSFNRMCIELLTLPKPTLAAITGHAIAGGCILTLCCDYRFIAQGRKLMGLNEIKLGVPVPYVADCILRELVGDRIAWEIEEGGDFYQPEESLRMGLVDKIVPIEQVLPLAIEKAQAMGELPGAAFRMIKRNRLDSIQTQLRAHLEARERSFIESWYSEEARERLSEARSKF
jgi:enoyl-CoA hydratase/carnithine racemase